MNSIIKKNEQHRSFFELRVNSSKADFDLSGYWSYPSFIESPAKGNGKQCSWLYLLLPTVHMPEKGYTALFRPKSMVITKENSKTILRYDNYRLGFDSFPKENWDAPIGMYPYKAIEGLTRQEFEKAEIDLIKNCDVESKRFAGFGDLSHNFISAWLNLTHPAFFPYLEHLAPSFMKALGLPGMLKVKGK